MIKKAQCFTLKHSYQTRTQTLPLLPALTPPKTAMTSVSSVPHTCHRHTAFTVIQCLFPVSVINLLSWPIIFSFPVHPQDLALGQAHCRHQIHTNYVCAHKPSPNKVMGAYSLDVYWVNKWSSTALISHLQKLRLLRKTTDYSLNS